MSKPTRDAVRSYLVSIGKIPLLSHQQELELGQKVQEYQRLLSLKEAMESDIGFALDHQQWAITVELPVKELKQRIRQGELAKKKLIEANLRLVVSIAKKYLNRGLELLDLIQEGSIGLTRAVEKFDPSKGFKFSTYAYWWIRQAMTRSIYQSSRTIRLPIHIYEQLNKLKRIRREISQKSQRPATLEEIAEGMKISEKEVRDLLKLSRDSCSLDKGIGDEENSSLIDLLIDDNYDPDEAFNHLHYQQESANCLELISEAEQRILWARFVEDKSLTVIGKELGVSRERIRQRQSQALRKVRAAKKVTINA